jgi:hypothetical protein
MRADILTMVAVLTVPTVAQQRGAVSGVSVHKATVQAGVPVEITITGANPCGAVRVDPGDDTERVTYPITQVPTTVRHTYHKSGQFKVRVEGMGNCDGAVSTFIQITAAPTAPSTATPPPAPPTPVRVSSMDADRDGVVTRGEWRGSAQAFRRQDKNNDGVLSGSEVQDDRNDVIVKATERWANTGVQVRLGDVVRIESQGTVQLSANTSDTSSPGGAGSGRRAASAPLPDRPAGGLIARIGNAPPIFVGADSTIRANASGVLYLGVNDDELSDNRGEYRVRIDAPSARRR